MKSYKSALTLSAALAFVSIAQAHADTTPGWYVGAGAGINFTQDSTATTSAGNTKITYDPSFSYLANVGYAYDNGLRTEFEVFRSRADVSSDAFTGHVSNTDLFLNGFYDFSTDTIFTPYVGVGVGLALASPDNVGAVKTGGYLDDDNVAEFAYQGIAGVAAQLDKHWAVTADYRFIGVTADPSYHISTGGRSRLLDEQHDILVGVRYSFGEPTVEPAQATVSSTVPLVSPVVPAKPIVAQVPQSYMVFFDFNKSDLTTEAKRIIASAAQDYKHGDYIRIVVTGHTDTVGTTKYNHSLSEKRAAAVKAELARLGVDSKVIVAKGVGKDGLLVPTADQVREAQNRRAEIVFSKQ